MKTIEVIVSGRVQRVGFRACIKRIAMNLGVTGEAMNLPDGRVKIIVTAEPAILEKFTSMLYSCSRVVIRDLKVNKRETLIFPDFSIVRQISQ